MIVSACLDLLLTKFFQVKNGVILLFNWFLLICLKETPNIILFLIIIWMDLSLSEIESFKRILNRCLILLGCKVKLIKDTLTITAICLFEAIIITIRRESNIIMTIRRESNIIITIGRESTIIMTIWRESNIIITIWRESKLIEWIAYLSRFIHLDLLWSCLIYFRKGIHLDLLLSRLIDFRGLIHLDLL